MHKKMNKRAHMKYSYSLLALISSLSPLWAANDFNSYLQSENMQTRGEKEVGVTSLQQTLEKTYMQNAELDATRAGLRATDESVSQAVSAWRPSLSVQGQQNVSWHRPMGSEINKLRSGNINKGKSYRTGYNTTLSQNIFAGGGTVARTGQAKSNVMAGRFDLKATEQKVLLDAVDAHVTVVSAENIVAFRKKNAERLSKTFEETKARYEVGLTSRAELLATEADFQGAKAEVVRAEGDLETARAAYLKQVGSQPKKLSLARVLIPLPKTYNEALALAQKNNPSLKQARFQIDAADYAVKIAGAALLPSVDLEGSVGNSRNKSYSYPDHITAMDKDRPSQRSTEMSVTAAVTIPIYPGGGAVSSQVREAYQRRSQAKISYVQAQREIEQSIKSAWETVNATKEAITSLVAQVKAKQVAVEGVTEEMRVGLKNVLDVLKQEQDLIDSQETLVSAQRSYVISCYQLLSAVGQLNSQSLKLKVKYYEPEAYYDEHAGAWIKFWEGDDQRYVKGEPKDE